MNEDKCREWSQERLNSQPKNPLTNRKIKINGPKYKKLEKDCKDLIVDMDSICINWLKEKHKDLYKELFPTIISVDDTIGEPQLDDFYTVDERKKFGEIIKEYFSSIIIAEGKACMTQSKTLLKYVSSSKLVGYGTYGNVYGVTIPKTNPPISVAIKEGYISLFELKRAMVNRYPVEYLYNNLINKLIDGKICPNFSYTFAIFFCNKCTLNEFSTKPFKTQCSETITEIFDFTLDELTDFRDEVILSLLFQILFAIASVQLKYGMFHNDIKRTNILIKVIPNGGYWIYNINNNKYYVPNHGYMAILNDFGVSRLYKPSLSNSEDYDRRQAEVVRDKEGEYKFKPFTTRFYPLIDTYGKVSSIASPKRKGITWNHFYKNFNSAPSISVDLENVRRFPPYYFNNDIADVMFMFIGGKRTTQPGYHTKLKISDYIFNLLKDYKVVKLNDPWPVDRVDLFLANHTIKKLFPSYLKLSVPGSQIEEYTLL